MIYVDNAATTKMYPEVLKEMLPYLEDEYGNASADYFLGRNARDAIEKSREIMVQYLGGKPEEWYFTSGGTESDNWAISSSMKEKPSTHLFVSAIEHDAVMKQATRLSSVDPQNGHCMPIDSNGIVKWEETLLKYTPVQNSVVSVMFVNNETGVIQPIEGIGKFCRDRGWIFHTDAVQAVGHIPVNVDDLNVDLLSLSAHKFHGPKGVGALYVKNKRIKPFIRGGGQEVGMRAGTENVAGIVGMAKALEICCEDMEHRMDRVSYIRERFEKQMMSQGCFVVGKNSPRAPGICNLLIPGVNSEYLLMLLDEAGICASAGSACHAGSMEPSHTLLAMGLSPEQARQCVRFSFGDFNTESQVDELLNKLLPFIKLFKKEA